MSKKIITTLVIIHLIALLWHDAAHQGLEVWLPVTKYIFVYVVIVIAPIGAVIAVWTRFIKIGVWLLLGSMIASLLFGVYHHYILISIDNIAHLPIGPAAQQNQFINSSAVIAILELATALYASFVAGVLFAQTE